MLPKLALICLLVGQSFANLGQGYSNNNQGLGQGHSNNNQGLGQGYSNNNQGLGQGYSNNNQGLGQGYSNNNQGLGQGYNNDRNGGLNQGSDNNGGLNRNPGIGQGDLNTNNGYNGDGYSGLGQSRPQSSQGGYYGQARQALPSDNVRAGSLGSGQQTTYSNDNAGLNSVPSDQQGRGYRRLKREVETSKQINKRSPNLGQDTKPQGLGQEAAQAKPLGQIEQPVAGGLGQAREESTSEALGQAEQPIAGGLGQAKQESTSEALGQPEQPLASGLDKGIQSGDLSVQSEPSTPSLNQKNGLGQFRAKRYSEREPYRKTCNTYYGKYICYRLYEKDSSIPNEFTCWSTYLGKQNCTETENVLYLDRRNVEVDPSELDRRFDDGTSDSSRRDYRQRERAQDDDFGSTRQRQRQRGQDDEFGAVEKNIHNSRTNERQLPSDIQEYGSSRQSSGSRRTNTRVYDDRELRREN